MVKIGVTYIICGDCSGGVAGYEFKLHVNLSIEILMFGLKPGARSLVK